MADPVQQKIEAGAWCIFYAAKEAVQGALEEVLGCFADGYAVPVRQAVNKIHGLSLRRTQEGQTFNDSSLVLCDNSRFATNFTLDNRLLQLLFTQDCDELFIDVSATMLGILTLLAIVIFAAVYAQRREGSYKSLDEFGGE